MLGGSTVYNAVSLDPRSSQQPPIALPVATTSVLTTVNLILHYYYYYEMGCVYLLNRFIAANAHGHPHGHERAGWIFRLTLPSGSYDRIEIRWSDPSQVAGDSTRMAPLRRS